MTTNPAAKTFTLAAHAFGILLLLPLMLRASTLVFPADLKPESRTATFVAIPLESFIVSKKYVAPLAGIEIVDARRTLWDDRVPLQVRGQDALDVYLSISQTPTLVENSGDTNGAIQLAMGEMAVIVR